MLKAVPGTLTIVAILMTRFRKKVFVSNEETLARALVTTQGKTVTCLSHCHSAATVVYIWPVAHNHS